MFTLSGALTAAVGVLLIGLSVAICVAFLYLLMRIIDRFFKNKEEVSVNDEEVQVKKKISKKDAEMSKDDVPFQVPIKVETSFDGKRIGKV